MENIQQNGGWKIQSRQCRKSTGFSSGPSGFSKKRSRLVSVSVKRRHSRRSWRDSRSVSESRRKCVCSARSRGWPGLAELGGQRGTSSDVTHGLDVDLLIGALALLREQFLETVDVAQQANIRVRGEAMRKEYFADRKNPRFGVSLLMPDEVSGETNHDY